MPHLAPQRERSADPVSRDGQILTDPNRRKEASAVALKTFVRISEVWGLAVDSQRRLLGDVPKATFHRWIKKAFAGEAVDLSRDKMERLSYILGIEKGLKTIFVNESAGPKWLKGANTDVPFSGRSPLQVMEEGGIVGLHDTREYLDAWRGVR